MADKIIFQLHELKKYYGQRLVLNDIGPFVPRAALQQIRTYVGQDPLFADLAEFEAYLRRVHAGFGRLSDGQWRHMAQHGARQTAAGWRLGYAVGPKPIIEQMTKLQQYSFVCAPSMTQLAGTLALDVDMSDRVEAYRRKRDRVVERLAVPVAVYAVAVHVVTEDGGIQQWVLEDLVGRVAVPVVGG